MKTKLLVFAKIGRYSARAQVQFILGVFLFVVVGLVDLRVPWPKACNLGPQS
jgi:hypothetical protein